MVSILIGSLRSYLIHPGVGIETNVETDGEVDTGIPVDQDENVEDYLENSKGVGEVGGGLSFIKELEHSFNLGNSVESEDDFTRDLVATFSREKEIQKVSGKNADDVFLEPAGLSVGCPQQLGILHHDPLVQITFMCSITDDCDDDDNGVVVPDEHVDDVDDIRAVVEDNPTQGK